MAEVVNLNMFGGETPQVSTMPTPSAELAGKILQYAGATDGNFTAGYFYKCVMANGIPLWQRTNVQPSNAGISWGGVDGNITDQTDLANALNGKAGKATVTFVVDTTEQLATKTAATGDTAIVKTTGKLHTYGSEAWDGGVNGEYGVIYLGEAEQYMWDTTKFVLVSTEDAKTLNGKSESYFAKENEVAKKDGRYPLMNVGSADNLTGGTKVSREFTEDTAGGSADIADGIAKVERVKGNSIVWNQLVLEPNFSDLSKWTEKVGIDIEDNADEITITTNTDSYNYNRIGIQIPAVNNNEKVLIRFRAKGDNNTSIFHKYILMNETYEVFNYIYTSVRDNDNYLRIYPNGDVGYFKQDSYITFDKSFGVLLFNLTRMFGAGNEPATVDEFEKMFPHDYYDYNAGEILSLNPTGIKTIGFNAYNPTTGKAYVIGGRQYQITGAYTSVSEGETTITPDSDGLFTPTKNGELTIVGGDNTTTCVHLVWSGKRNGEYEEHWKETCNIPVAQINTDGTITESAEGKTRLFPDGLCSAGSVYDEITPTKAIKRIGKVDLGNAEWLFDDIYSFFWRNISNAPKRTFEAISDFIYSKGIKMRVQDKQYYCYGDTNPNFSRIAIRDDSYTDAASLRAAMSGVYLYYELNTPIEVSFDEPLNLNYRVSDFGTETLLPINTSTPTTTPIKMDVMYGLNVVDTVRNLSRNYLGMTGTQNTFAVIASALSAYGITMTLGAYNESDKYYPVTISGGWKPASAAPASASATGKKGMYYIDSEYFYVCVDTDTWKRFALSTW